jgi:hypothetical protein
MKKIILLIFSSMFFIKLSAQKYVKLEEVIKPGTQLRYLVAINDSVSYNFTVTVKQLVPAVIFDWEMDKVEPLNGTIIHTVKAMQAATFLHNYFKQGEEKLDDNTVSVWLSKKIFTHFSKYKGKVMNLGMYGPGQPLVPMATNNVFNETSILYNGTVVKIKEVMAVRMKKNGTQWLQAGNGFFSFYNSVKMPIITSMRTDFFISLEEITTK